LGHGDHRPGRPTHQVVSIAAHRVRILPWPNPHRPQDKEKNMLWFIVVLLVVGLLAGALARLLVPGKDPMGLAGTWLLGVVGSFVGGFLGYLLFGADAEDGAVQVSGVLGSIVGAIIVLLVYRSFKNRR
jgi:uncharacterized membrane protein YeaQ/YmgE (transglycosylase-associated protein family)